MDVFTWSLPFVGEKSTPCIPLKRITDTFRILVTDMLIAILNCCTKEELEEEEEETPMAVTPGTPEAVASKPSFRLSVSFSDPSHRSGRWLERTKTDHQKQDLGGRSDVAGICSVAVSGATSINTA